MRFAQLIISFSMTKRRFRRNRRDQNRHVAHLPQNLRAKIVAIGSRSKNGLATQRFSRQRDRIIFFKNGAERSFVPFYGVGKKLRHHRPKEKPPAIDHAIEPIKPKRLNRELRAL